MTVEIPDKLGRTVKSRAARLEMPLRRFVTEALLEKLQRHLSTKGKPWMKSVGKLSHLHEENVRIQQLIDEEFGRLDG
jgi:hypothetical protein